jgi:hypothetical protein
MALLLVPRLVQVGLLRSRVQADSASMVQVQTRLDLGPGSQAPIGSRRRRDRRHLEEEEEADTATDTDITLGIGITMATRLSIHRLAAIGEEDCEGWEGWVRLGEIGIG